MGRTGKAVIILCAEDDPEDRMLVEDAMEESRLANELHFVEDGEELMDYLHRRGKYTELSKVHLPGLILLDLNMPKKDGREALEEIKADPNLRRIPIVVLTTSKTEEDILRTYDLGVNGFIIKPVTFESLVSIMKTVSKYWFEIVEPPPQITRG
jgi:CheY-like chemotaxis protein